MAVSGGNQCYNVILFAIRQVHLTYNQHQLNLNINLSHRQYKVFITQL